MLVIPASTVGVDVLRVLVTDDPAAAGVAAVTPDLAAVLYQRWVGAAYTDGDGERELVLPLRPTRAA